MPVADDPTAFLAQLSNLLKNPLLPVQQVIAKEIGEDQPFVSNAGRGVLKRVTERVQKLYDYANSRIEAEKRAGAAAQSVDNEMHEAKAHPSAVALEAKGRAKLTASADFSSDEAMSDLKAYLDDGYDPRLIVEQLVVLRRAQHLRRPGRRRAGSMA